jgi:hypothetical protein
MTDDNNEIEPKRKRRKVMEHGGTWGSIYGMAFIGSVIYFLQHATSFWNGVWGIIKAIFWPAVLLYKALELLKM